MTHYKIILAGDTGTGKTSQFETMPGRRYAHVFDPAAHSTLRLADDQYENFFPEDGDLNLLPQTAIKGGKRLSDGAASPKGPQVYLRWAKRMNELHASGFFNQVDSFMLDSATLLGLHLMERQRWLGDKQGREDERQDHRMAGETMINALWSIFSLPCHVLVTMHTKYVETKVGETKTGAMHNRLTVPGGSQLMLPRFVSACWYTEVVEDRKTGRASYQVMTRAQPRWPHVRTPRAWGHLPLWHNVTIEDWARPQDFGLGRLINDHT